MSISGFPTSSDKATASRSSRNIEAFGESEPIATIEGQRRYNIELTRLYATDDAISDGIDFYSIADFSLVIAKPDRRIVYTGCQWSDIEESGEIGDMVVEKINVIASKRVESAQ